MSLSNENTTAGTRVASGIPCKGGTLMTLRVNTHSFPHPSGPTTMKGCLLLPCSQGENMSRPLCTSVVRTTGREPPLRSEIMGLSGTCGIKPTELNMKLGDFQISRSQLRF